jgi:hypothetical protein
MANDRLLEKIREIYTEFEGKYGSPRIYQELAACRKSSLQAVNSRHNHEINNQEPPKTGGCNHQNRPFDRLFPFVFIQQTG